MEEIKIELMEGGILPQREFLESGGYDLYVPKRTQIQKGKQIIPLGFKIAVPKGKVALIFARSGTESKGVNGWLSESNGQLCNVAIREEGIDDDKRKYLSENDSVYYIDWIKQIDSSIPGKAMYYCRYREKITEPIRIDDACVKLGMVDCGYRGEVGMIIENRGCSFYVEQGQSIAQMVIIDIPQTVLVQTDKLESSEDGRGEQGFMG